jgi:hypothetical protein
MFNLQTPKNTRVAEKVPKASSLVTTKGALYFYSLTTGLLQLAGVATTSNQSLYRANETIAAADARVDVHCLQVNLGDRFLVDTVNNTNVNMNGQRMILDATGLLLTNTGTDVSGVTGVFQQIAPCGVAADKKILAERVS